MKTIQDLQNRREELVSVVDRIQSQKKYGKNDKARINKAVREVKLIDLCGRYLESNPDEEFVETALRDTLRKIKIIRQRYSQWCPPQGVHFKDDCARKKHYERTMDIPRLQGYEKTLTYLLK